MSKDSALEILNTPLEKLSMASDYYKAVFHLFNYPCKESEIQFMKLLESDSSEEPIVIARRKAIEGLAYFNCQLAIPLIAKCLKSEDPILVENAALALAKLDCHEQQVISDLVLLLEDSSQNIRVLIQSLRIIGSTECLDKLKLFASSNQFSPGIRGAAIASLAILSEHINYNTQLPYFLRLANQNDRQCAIQDIIDAKAIELIPLVSRCPVSPFFRLRAIDLLYQEEYKENSSPNNLYPLEYIDSILLDKPDLIDLINPKSSIYSIEDEFLIDQMFSTDFDQTYTAIRVLSSRQGKSLWRLLSNRLDACMRDYGALYSFIVLFRHLTNLDCEPKAKIRAICMSAFDKKWPPFMKFKPAAIITLMSLFPNESLDYIPEWLDEDSTPSWSCRYATLICIEDLLKKNDSEKKLESFICNIQDSHRFVAAKSQKILSSL